MNTAMLAFLGTPEILVIFLVLLVMAGMAAAAALLLARLLGRHGAGADSKVHPREAAQSTCASGTCPRCGTALPPNSPQGLCPRCVLGVGLATETEATGEAGSHGTKVVPPPEAEVARRFPHLEIVGCLGHGGMGAVYKARQPKLNRLVALKILSPERGADPKFAERFLREAQALARLSHPNIVTVHDFGEADGMFFLLMEYVDGMTLRQLLRESRMKPEEALAIVPKICEALQFAHEQGVVHRDIKPENVLLDKQGRVKIADFGIAKLVGADRPPAALTEERSVIGTPHYMAPEQVEKPQLVDHRADIYSLGVVFYEMLTGELPLGKFQPPSKKVQVDVRLDEVVLHALEKEPDRRYQHASEVKTDVESIASTPPSPEPSASSLATAKQRHGLQMKAACLFFAAVCFLIAAVSFALSNNAIAAVLSGVAIVGFSLAGFRHLSGAVATTAASGPRFSAPQIEQVHRQVQGPAIGLLVTGIANWILVPLMAVFLLPNALHTAKTAQLPQVVAVGLALTPLVLCSFIIYAALKMMQLERRGAAIAASIFAILVTPGNLLGLPLGIWALVVLSQPRVRQAFGSTHSLPLAGSGPARTAPESGAGAWKVAVVIAAAVLLVPAGVIWVSITLPYLWLQREVTAVDPSSVVRVEAKLRHEIERRLGEGGWRLEGLSVNVTPNFKGAECRFGKIWKNGLTTVPPPPAAIHLKPQGSSLWLVRGEGEFQWLRFSVDSSAEMAVPLRNNPLTALAISFGSVREVTLNDIDELRGGEALDLDSGQLIDLPKDIEKRPESEQMQWLKDRGADLLLDNVGGRWGLMTATANELLLRPLENGRWSTLTEEVLANALADETAGLEIKQRGAWRVYVFAADPQLPFTFALQTANGVRGLLQITRFTENPNSAQLRFKLIETASALGTAGQKPSFGQAVEAVLPFGAPCLNHYLQFRSGQGFTIGRGPATTESEYAEDWKRAEEAGGVDASAIRLKDGIQLIGEGCIFTQEHGASWSSLTADEVLRQLRHTSWVSGVVEPKTKDFPITYLFKTAHGECGLLQVLEVVEDERGYAGAGKQGQGLKLRYKFVQSTLALVASNEVKAASLRKFVRLVVDPTQMTFEGQSTTWEAVGLLLANVPDRAHTVLEFAVTSDQITVAQQNEWFHKAGALARQHGFEYASFIGIHPLGSKGSAVSP